MCTLAVILTMLLLAPVRGQAQREGPVLIQELMDEDLERIDLHDGSVQDWLQVVGEPTLRPVDFQINDRVSRTYHDPGDLDFRLWLAWHGASNHVYMVLERADDIHINRFNTGGSNADMMRQDPTISFYIDGNNAGDCPDCFLPETISTEYFLVRNQKAQRYTAIAETFDEGPHLWLEGHSQFYDRYGWYVLPPYADSGGGVFGENPTLSVVELYVTPFDLFVYNDREACQVSDLEAGKVISLFVVVNDVDDMNNRDGELQYYATFQGLLVESLPPLEIAAVPGDIEVLKEASWGRLKTVSGAAEKSITPRR